MAGDASTVSAGAASRARGLYDIGLIYEKQGLIKEAYEEFKEALRLDPSDIDIIQKYEELYRHPTVQQLLASEQSRTENVIRQDSGEPESWPPSWGCPTNSVSASSSSMAGQRKSRGLSSAQQGGLSDDIPPTFTFTSETAMSSDGASQEPSSRVVQFAAGIFQTGLASQGPGPNHWFREEGNMATAEDDAQDARLGFGYDDAPKTLAATIFCWVVIFLSVTYYYQIIRREQCQEEISYPAIVIWTVTIIVLAAATFRCATTCRVKHFNLSDGIKFTCLIIIVVAVLWHKLWQEPAYLARKSSGKNQTCSLFTDTPQG